MSASTLRIGFVLLWAGLSVSLMAEEPLKDELPRIPPKSPTEALKTFQMVHGFRLELVAHEPLVSDPVDACFDARGRMYVAEMHGYPYSFEKRPQQPEGGGKKDAGVVRLLTDTDNDGKMDQSTAFATGITWPTSVCCYDDGVFVLAPPHLHYFKDTNNDGIADVKEIIFSGFSRSNVQALANNMKWGLDQRIYLAGGRNGGTLTRNGKKLLTLGRVDLAFDPRTKAVEAISGGSQFGHSFDDWGNRFVCSNSNHMQHVWLESRYLQRNKYQRPPGFLRSIAKEGGAAPVFRQSPAEPWRIVRTRRRAADPNYRKRLPPTELVPIGFFTSATGVTFARGDAYPAEFRHNAFIGDVGGNLVHRKIVTPNKASFLATRADQRTEFLTSTDNWFRPVNFVNAPDGTLYLLDMYRETIEHPVSIPPDIKAHLDLEGGHDRGRIYRITPPGWKHRATPDLGKLPAGELIHELTSDNAWNRETAARLIWERQDETQTAAIKKIALHHSAPLGRLHALWTLKAIGSLDLQTLQLALHDPDPLVRANVVRLSEPYTKNSDSLRNELLMVVNDPDYRMRFQMALSAGEFPPELTAKLLTALATHPETDREMMQVAILSSSAKVADKLAAALLNTTADPRLLADLCGIVASQQDATALGKLLRAVTKTEVPIAQQILVLESIGTGLAQRRSSLMKFLQLHESLKDVQTQVEELFQRAGQMVTSPQRAITERQQYLRLLGFAESVDSVNLLRSLLTPQTPPELQLTAVQSLERHRLPNLGEVLLQPWSNYSPTVRKEVVDVLLKTPAGTQELLTKVERKVVKPTELDRSNIQILTTHPQAKIRDRAQTLLGSVTNADRQKIVTKYEAALKLKPNVLSGRKVFMKNCSNCHQVGKEGHKVGPELTSVKNKSPRDLLIAILDPSREAQPNYTAYTLVTKEGKLLNGMIVSETSQSVTLRRAEAKEDVVLRENIQMLKSNGVSLMPVGVEKEISLQQMADLLEFVRTLTAPAVSTP